jgi:hypothetical protein
MRITWRSGRRRWRCERRVAVAGVTESGAGSGDGRGPESFSAAVSAMLDDARGWRPAELRRRRGLTQEQVADRMSVSVARVSQIENGDVSTQEC